MKIILGSQSKGRREILRSMGYEFEVMSADIDERAIRFDDPRELTLALARAKADALLPLVSEPSLLITVDQVVMCNGQILEKPENEDEARSFLVGYATHPPESIVAMVVHNTVTGQRYEGIDVVGLTFLPFPGEVLDRIVSQDETFDRAGGFTVGDPLIKPYIVEIRGEAESVIGLPKVLTERLLVEAGLERQA